MELLYDAGLVTRWAAKKIKLWNWLMRLSENSYEGWAKNHKFNRNF